MQLYGDLVVDHAGQRGKSWDQVGLHVNEVGEASEDYGHQVSCQVGSV